MTPGSDGLALVDDDAADGAFGRRLREQRRDALERPAGPTSVRARHIGAQIVRIHYPAPEIRTWRKDSEGDNDSIVADVTGRKKRPSDKCPTALNPNGRSGETVYAPAAFFLQFFGLVVQRYGFLDQSLLLGRVLFEVGLQAGAADPCRSSLRRSPA